MPVFEDYLLDPTNPMQDLIDSERVARCWPIPIARSRQSRSLYDLLSVAIWLGQDEQELRIHRADEMDVRGVFSPLDYREPVLLGDEALPSRNRTSRYAIAPPISCWTTISSSTRSVIT